MSFFTCWDGTSGAAPVDGARNDGIPVDQSELIEEADHVTPLRQSPVLRRVPQEKKPVTQAQKISSLEEQVKEYAQGYAQIMEGLEEQLRSLSVVASRIRTVASSVTPTSQVHVQAPNVTPTHPLVGPGLERPFEAQSKPASSPGRAQDTRRDLLNVLRLAMNEVMRMERDKDIVGVRLASAEEAEEYELEKDDARVQPTLDPMRPFLPKPNSPWNKKLWRLLAASIAKRHEFDQPTWKEMEKAFYERLKRLNSVLKSEMQAIHTPSSSRVRAPSSSRVRAHT